VGSVPRSKTMSSDEEPQAQVSVEYPETASMHCCEACVVHSVRCDKLLVGTDQEPWDIHWNTDGSCHEKRC